MLPGRRDRRNSTGWSVFTGDLGRSIEAIGAAPMLVVLTIALNLAFFLGGAIVFIGLPLVIFEAGFVGTQRAWFDRVYRGERMPGREILSLTRSFVWRFVRLGVVVGIVLAPITILARRPHGHTDSLAAVGLVVELLLIDIGLTFVVPALALSTRSVRDAFRIGLRMIAATWPMSAWYLLTPGLTLGLLGSVSTFDSYRPDVALRVAIIVSTTILSVLFKGAIVAFYVRQPSPDRAPPA